jgi:hypothetical protein
MKKWLHMLPLILVTACSHLTVSHQEGTGVSQTRDLTLHSFLFGFISGVGPGTTQDFCPGGKIRTLDLRMSGLDVVMAVGTLGLYVPQRAKVQCSLAPEHQATAHSLR